MKHTIWNRSLLIGLISSFYFILSSGLTAENFATLQSFAPDEGIGPYAELFQTQGRLYGTTYAGGASNQGTVFSVNTDGTGFTNLHSFNGASGGEHSFGGIDFIWRHTPSSMDRTRLPIRSRAHSSFSG